MWSQPAATPTSMPMSCQVSLSAYSMDFLVVKPLPLVAGHAFCFCTTTCCAQAIDSSAQSVTVHVVDNTPPAHAESSLFVYPDKFVLKTCGTTQLLNAVPLLLELAASLGCQAVRCKYSRASFLFPEYQVRRPLRPAISGWLPLVPPAAHALHRVQHLCLTCLAHVEPMHLCIAMKDAPGVA